MELALRRFFEEQLRFRLADGTEIEGGVYIGSTEFLPVEILHDDDVAYREEFLLWLSEVWKPEQTQRREEILSLVGNGRRYSDLKEVFGRQQVVPFVGSGMSVPSGLPTWADLLRRIRDYAKCDHNELESFLCAQQFEEAADFLASKMNIRLLNERIEHELRIDEPKEVRGPVLLLPALFPNLVLTTNLDRVLEHVYSISEREFGYVLAGEEIGQYRSLKSSTARCLMKLHGDCTRSIGRVLLTSEYETTYANESTVRAELSLLYRTSSLLFLGCSLGWDRTVSLIYEVAEGDLNMPKHYCFLQVPDKEEVRLDREHFLTERGVYPIWYNLPHDIALTALLDGLLNP
jgi:hypothetical protein